MLIPARLCQGTQDGAAAGSGAAARAPSADPDVDEHRHRSARRVTSSKPVVLLARVDLLDGLQDGAGVVRPNEAGDFLAVAEEDQCGPELHAKGAPEATPGTVFDFQVTHVRMMRERGRKQWLCGATIPAPRGAEFYDGRARQCVHFGARRLDARIHTLESHAAPAVLWLNPESVRTRH